MFTCYHHVNIMPAAQTMIKNRQQAIGIGWQINSYYICFFIDYMIEKTRILVGKTIVILLPYVRRQVNNSTMQCFYARAIPQ